MDDSHSPIVQKIELTEAQCRNLLKYIEDLVCDCIERPSPPRCKCKASLYYMAMMAKNGSADDVFATVRKLGGVDDTQ